MNLTYKRHSLTPLAIAASLLALAAGARAQHYPAGAEGIRAATLPPPGIYLRDYNFFYFTDGSHSGPDLFAYMNAPRVVWMTGQRILGADYGMDLIVPFGYASASVVGPGNTFREFHRVTETTFNLGDIQFEPLLLSWHLGQFDLAAGYAIWAPTGDFDANRMVNIGKGCWSHMLTAGATWYLDEARTWAVSLLNRYEINHEQDETVVFFPGMTRTEDVTLGQTLTMEWGLSKTISKDVDVGFVGYWQQQTTGMSVNGSTSDSLSYVVGLGPEVSAVIPQLGLVSSLRYLREVAAENRPEGNTVTVTLTKRF
jgi:hypothetical protein